MCKQKLFTLLGGVFALLGSIACLFSLSVPTINERRIEFESSYKEKSVTLKGSFYETKDSEYAVLICPGYSCDRQKWRPFADLFVSNGYSTMTFDYSGQGASYGTIGFDNAKTDWIPVQIDDAVEKLHDISGVDYSKIILVGHSMGGRSVLRLLYDYHHPEQTTISYKPIKNVILMSPEVNYLPNAQASLFAGTSDKDEEPWKSFLPSDIQGSDVYLFGSTADDIVSDEDILAIYEKLGATNLPKSGPYQDSQTNVVGSKIEVGIVNGVLHSYQMYSPQFAKMVNRALTSISGKPTTYNPNMMLLVYFGWGLGLAGVGVTLFALNMPGKRIEEETVLLENGPKLIDAKKFLFRKLLMWVPGIIMALLVMVIAAIMPFGSPIMNVPYMCFIAGYGLTMLIHFSKGRFAGVEGKLPRLTFKATTNWRKVAHGIGVSVLILSSVWYILWQTMYRLVPANWRLFHLFYAGTLMSIGYYISGVEGDMLKEAKASRLVRFLYQLIQYVPLFLFVGFYAAIGSWSGFIGQMQNMVLMYILCVPLGNYTKKQTGNRLYGAIASAFLFQTLMITSAALISFF
ncbi:MAG: alpha/beta hydrolase [Bacilli bacterium]|nr:alpha/beta hydrolase [Bacilli bacterium]